MRLPVVPQISTKDGVSNKNARLTNCLKESKKGGDKAVVRPGLVLDAQASGVGHGLVVFNNELVSVYGATLGFGVEPGALTPNTEVFYASAQYIAGIVYANGEFVMLGYDDATESDNFWANGDGELFGVQNYIGNANNINSCASDGTEIVFISDTIFHTTTSMAGNYDFSAATVTVNLGGPTFRIVRYLGGKFVVVAYNGSSNQSEIYSSADGATWASSGVLSGVMADVSYDGTTWRFYGGDAIPSTSAEGFSTTDFVTFTPLTLSFPAGWDSVYFSAYVGGAHFAIAYDLVNLKLHKSTDGLTYTEVTASNVSNFLGLFTLEVYGGYVYTMGEPNPLDVSNTHLFRTSDGITWEDYCSIDGAYPNTTHISFGPALAVAFQQYNQGYVPILSYGEATATIPALATITGDYYDFAQSPI